MHVVRRLRRGPERQLSVRPAVGDRGVLLERQVRVALVEEEVLVDAVGAGKARLAYRRTPWRRACGCCRIAVVVDRHVPPAPGPRRSSRRAAEAHTSRRSDRARRMPRPRRWRRRRRPDRRRSGRDPGTTRARPARPAGCRRGWAGPAGQRPRSRPASASAFETSIATMRACAIVRTQELAVQHARQHHVVGKPCLARDLGCRVDLRVWPADDARRFPRSVHASVLDDRKQPGFVEIEAVKGLASRLGVLAAHPGRRELHGLEDLDVAGAAAEIAGEGFA